MALNNQEQRQDEIARDNVNRNQPSRAPRVFTYEEDEPDNDISAIPQGAKAITGKYFTSAMQANRFDHEASEAKEREGRDAMEFMAKIQLALADWDNEEIDVGGMQMTRKEAHQALGRVVQAGKQSAEWAVARGYIREDEKDEYIMRAKRLYDLEEEERGLKARKKAGGSLTPEEEQRLRDIKAEQSNPRYQHIDQGIRNNTAYERQQLMAEQRREFERQHASESPESDPKTESIIEQSASQRSISSAAGVADDSPMASLDSISAAFESVASPEIAPAAELGQVASAPALQQKQIGPRNG